MLVSLVSCIVSEVMVVGVLLVVGKLVISGLGCSMWLLLVSVYEKVIFGVVSSSWVWMCMVKLSLILVLVWGVLVVCCNLVGSKGLGWGVVG